MRNMFCLHHFFPYNVFEKQVGWMDIGSYICRFSILLLLHALTSYILCTLLSNSLNLFYSIRFISQVSILYKTRGKMWNDQISKIQFKRPLIINITCLDWPDIVRWRNAMERSLCTVNMHGMSYLSVHSSPSNDSSTLEYKYRQRNSYHTELSVSCTSCLPCYICTLQLHFCYLSNYPPPTKVKT
jgi:hypothetical protein